MVERNTPIGRLQWTLSCQLCSTHLTHKLLFLIFFMFDVIANKTGKKDVLASCVVQSVEGGDYTIFSENLMIFLSLS